MGTGVGRRNREQRGEMLARRGSGQFRQRLAERRQLVGGVDGEQIGGRRLSEEIEVGFAASVAGGSIRPPVSDTLRVIPVDRGSSGSETNRSIGSV